MLTLTFEVTPKPGHHDHYFNRAAGLKPLLEQHEGLLHLERYAQMANSDIILSHQFWQDEAAIVNWRKDAKHYQSQVAGRNIHFDDYRIRIAEVLAHRVNGRDFATAEADASRERDRTYVLVECDGSISAPDDMRYTSVTRDGAMIALHLPKTPEQLAAIAHAYADTDAQLTLSRIVRDYTMQDRAEAPQEF